MTSSYKISSANVITQSQDRSTKSPNMAADVAQLFFIHLLLFTCASVHCIRHGSKAQTLHFPHQESQDGIRRIRRNIQPENEEAAPHRSRVARQANNSPASSGGSQPQMPSSGSGSDIKVTKVRNRMDGY